jgi:hypothetical protein
MHAYTSLAQQLDVLYLGTDPPTQAVVSSDTHKELDYEATDAEHRELLQVRVLQSLTQLCCWL